MQDCDVTDRRFENDTRDVEGSEPRTGQFFEKPMKLPSRTDKNVLELAEIFEFHRGAGRDIRHQRQGRSGDNEIPERRLFPATAAAGCRIFIEDGAKLRVVRISNMQSGRWPFSSATIDVNYRDIVVPSFALLLLPSTPCGGNSDRHRQC